MTEKEKKEARSISPVGRSARGQFRYPYGARPKSDFQQLEGYDASYARSEEAFHYQLVLSREKMELAFMAIADLFPRSLSLIVKIRADLPTQIERIERADDEIYDTFISDEVVSKDEALNWARRWRPVIFDDGFFGFGFFSERSNMELFIDEHKVFQIYYPDPDIMETLLAGIGAEFIFQMPFFSDEEHIHRPLAIPTRADLNYRSAFASLADRFDIYLESLELEEEELDDDEREDFPQN